MIDAAAAKDIILKNTENFGFEEVPFLKSVGRVLKENIYADRPFPPFNRVAMDGIAIVYHEFNNGRREFPIAGIQAAGSEQETMHNAAHCYEVMTGASLPKNTDTVVRYEDVEIKNGIAKILVSTINKGQNIHKKGTDQEEGSILIQQNTIISPAEIGIIATVGKSTVKVAKTPKVIVISTGNELVEVSEKPLDHQIRRSNVYTLVSLLEKINIPAETAHLTDDKQTLKEKIRQYLVDFDALLFSGAVSKGKYDFLPEVLEELGVQKEFHRVSQRPGKPFWFGSTLTTTQKKEPNKNTVVFAFPGNPISTYVNCMVYFYSWFFASNGVTIETKTAILKETVQFKPNLTYFLQVKLAYRYGHWIAMPVKGNGSGDLANLTKADGFLEIPKSEASEFKEGSVFPVITYRDCY